MVIHRMDRDKANGIERDRPEFRLTKRWKEIGINLDRERGIKKQRWMDKRQKQIQVVIRIIDWIKKIGLKDIYVNLDLQKDGKRQGSISIEKEV